MKKLFFVFIAAGVVFVSCNGSKTANVDSSAPAPVATAQTLTFVGDWYGQMTGVSGSMVFRFNFDKTYSWKVNNPEFEGKLTAAIVNKEKPAAYGKYVIANEGKAGSLLLKT